jgi:osmoprotectant transport system permease protein
MDYIFANPGNMLILIKEHIQLTIAATMLAVFVGVPIGILINRFRALATPVIAVTGLMYLIPSLALFAVLIPILGLGIKPAIVALVMYSLLVIVRNTFTGLNVVGTELLEAASGMGMSRWQRLWWVELPLSLPVVMGGIRISVVMNIGVASIAAYIGAGGLGTLIFRGIATVDNQLILAGAIPISLLAMAADWLLRRTETGFRRGRSLRALSKS